MRFFIYNRDYDQTVYFGDGVFLRRVYVGPFPDDKKWVVEAVDGGHETYYATHEEAINSIYEGSK